MNEELLEAEEIKEKGKVVGYTIKGKIDERITNLNGRNRIIKNGKTVKIDIKLIFWKDKPMFRVREYA
jgi:hypothetical protein